MDKDSKLKFISDLCNDIKNDISSKVHKMPENWDGIELRWLIAEKCNSVVMGSYNGTKSRRYKDYKNEVLVKNL